MEVNQILRGDCLQSLKTMPDKFIDCCITSPPYYGLRDYGTGKWVGGDPNCPHRNLNPFGSHTSVGTHKKMQELGLDAGNSHIYKRVCKKCGAIREDLQVGLEETPEEYIQRLVDIFAEVKRVMKDDGTLWINIGDSYAGGAGRWGGTDDISEMQSGSKGSLSQIGVAKKWEHETIKQKDLIGIPWMLAFALRKDGWYLRQDIIWHKPNPMPESVKDRCTKSHEYIFLLSKSPRYYFDQDAIMEDAISDPKRYEYPMMNGVKEQNDGKRPDGGTNTGGMKEWTGRRNKRDVWSVIPSTFKGAHFATFPTELVEPMLFAGCPEGGTVLDPFMGSGTVGVVAKENNRNYVGCELNDEYADIAEKRLSCTMKSLF